MTEFQALHRRRRYLLEQIGKAADEINAIDDRLALLRSSSLGRDPRWFDLLAVRIDPGLEREGMA
jgi:hypothetical protein